MLRASKWIRYLLLAAVLSSSVPAYAWDGSNEGVPGLIEVAQGGNAGFRVYLTGLTSMCGPSTPSWWLGHHVVFV